MAEAIAGQSLKPEQKARDTIDQMLDRAGWKVQSKNKIDFGADFGIAIRKYQTDAGPSDYVLFIDKNPVGVIDAKPEDWGQKITTVEDQSGGYATAKLKWLNNKGPRGERLGITFPLVHVCRGERDPVDVAAFVEEALRLFGLSLPVDPADIKRKYRSLASVHHPDRNPGSPHATEKMKALNSAFEVLTGVDPNTLGFEESDTTYFARTEPDQVIRVAGIRLEITMTGETPQDWVYAASFAAADGGAYVATYSGRVILLSQEGRALVVYGIGTCPSEIVEIGRYTYFLTPTRLYVVEDGTKLAAFLDVYRQGRLIVSQSGFGLLTNKRLQWFSVAGRRVGELAARDPIRAIHAAKGGAIVQTRQDQVKVCGLAM